MKPARDIKVKVRVLGTYLDPSSLMSLHSSRHSGAHRLLCTCSVHIQLVLLVLLLVPKTLNVKGQGHSLQTPEVEVIPDTTGSIRTSYCNASQSPWSVSQMYSYLPSTSGEPLAPLIPARYPGTSRVMYPQTKPTHAMHACLVMPPRRMTYDMNPWHRLSSSHFLGVY